jgi:DNA-directed RNA polymerase subunit E'/Rpb7
MEAVQKPKYKKKQSIENNILFSRALITRSISLPIVNIGKNVQQTIERYIIENFEGKCVVEGFIKVGSCKIVTHSSGLVKGTNIGFEVVFECKICCPVEGMLIQCVAKNITKAGIRAESLDETPSPIVAFITRDHHYMVQYFSTIEEGTKFTARVIGQRFELNDKYVSVIAELVEPKKDYATMGMNKEPSKPKLVIEED